MVGEIWREIKNGFLKGMQTKINSRLEVSGTEEDADVVKKNGQRQDDDKCEAGANPATPNDSITAKSEPTKDQPEPAV